MSALSGFSSVIPLQLGANLRFSETTAEYISGAAQGTLPEQVFEFAPSIDLTPDYAETIVAGSARFTLGGKTYIERQGRLDIDINHANGAGTQAGTLSLGTGQALLTAWTSGASNSGTVQSLTTTMGGLGCVEVIFRTASAPIRPGSLIFQFQYADLPGTVTVTSDTGGNISAADVDGKIDFQTGIVRIAFGRWVAVTPEVQAQPWYFVDAVVNGEAFQPREALADTMRYAAVAYSYIPLDADILGINPVRLPTDGRVPIFRSGDVVVLHHTDSTTVATPTNSLEVDLGRERLSRVWLFDEGDNDIRVATNKYEIDLDAGVLTFIDVSGLVGPIRIEHRIEDMGLCSDAQINGQLTFTRPITHDYPALTTGVSSALVIGDMQARATKPFDQATWTNVWSDSVIGSSVTAQYNDILYPIEVTNIGAAQERWALIFNNTTEVRVVGENVGQIATLPIAQDIAPMNPVTNRPYFTIESAGWGAGWAAGNVLRFNTVAANFPVWIARTIQQSVASQDSDGFRIQIRGDADA